MRVEICTEEQTYEGILTYKNNILVFLRTEESIKVIPWFKITKMYKYYRKDKVEINIENFKARENARS